jgi:hypothetical protein
LSCLVVVVRVFGFLAMSSRVGMLVVGQVEAHSSFSARSWILGGSHRPPEAEAPCGRPAMLATPPSSVQPASNFKLAVSLRYGWQTHHG